MKILIDARMYGLEYTGIGRYLINLIDNLKNLETRDEFIILLRKKYFDTVTFPKNWKKVLSDIPHYTIREQILIPGVIKKHNPDVVHFPHINVPILYKDRYVLTVHDLTMQNRGFAASKLTFGSYILKRILFLLIAKKAVKNAMKIIVPSKTTATALANYYNLSIEKISVIYEGCSFRSFNENLPGELQTLVKYSLLNKEYFFYVGNAYPHKNLEIVIRTIKNINEKKKIHVQFVIAGLNDYFHQRLNTYIKDIGASSYIRLVGYVKDEELPILYKNSLGFIYPSLNEGFGLQGLEAISMGTVLACSNISIFQEIYGFNALYFDPKNMDSISGTLSSVITMKKEDKHRYVRNAQKIIKNYSWKKMAEETLEEYKKVTDGKGSGN